MLHLHCASNLFIFMQKIYFTLLLVLSVYCAQATTYIGYQVLSYAGNDVNLRIWSNCSTPFGQGVSAQLRYGVNPSYSYTGFIAGIYDNTGYPGANYRNDITVPGSATDIYVELAICDYGTNNNCYNYTGFPAQNFVAAGPLPVTLLSFEAKKTAQNTVELTWQTAMERNNDYFEVEYATDMQQWSVIGTVDGSENSGVVRTYTFVHENAASGDNYYRLRQVDNDGRAEYTVARKVVVDNKATTKVSPNPVLDAQVNIALDKTNTGTAQIRLFDLMGRVVLERMIEAENQQIFTLDLSAVSNGVFLLQVNQEAAIRLVKG